MNRRRVGSRKAERDRGEVLSNGSAEIGPEIPS
jgi:hypothetical protein